jgi:predicted anti-sigma-YlaC factor YlaD
MKCDDCLNLLAEYIDGEAIEGDAEQVSAHLIKCAACASEFEALTAEQEIYARYDRELNVSPAMWHAIEARTTTESVAVTSSSKSNPRTWLAGLFVAPRFGFAFSGAVAVFIVAVVIGVMYLRTHQQPPGQLIADSRKVKSVTPPDQVAEGVNPPGDGDVRPSNAPGVAPVKAPSKSNVAVLRSRATNDQSDDVLFSDAAYSDIEDKATADHVEQAQNLLKSIRNLQVGDGDDEIDVTYEKTLSRRLLNENVVLRRDAEMAGKFPAKTLLGSLEPFLIDIANLPDKTTPNELRELKNRVQKTEIVAALQSY